LRVVSRISNGIQREPQRKSTQRRREYTASYISSPHLPL
jgi:hypothetical protein